MARSVMRGTGHIISVDGICAAYLSQAPLRGGWIRDEWMDRDELDGQQDEADKRMDGDMMRIALTGGIAAGKTTVARRFVENGVPVIDYDLLARRVVEPESDALREIVERFGPHSVTTSGQLDRRWIADQVFGPGSDPHARRDLDLIVHPRVFTRARHEELALGKGLSCVVHDVPLLAEVRESIPFHFDHVVSVEAPEDVRVSRMMTTRGMSESQARGRIAGQPSREERLRMADIVIDATQPISVMMLRVDSLAAQWKAQEAARHTV